MGWLLQESNPWHLEPGWTRKGTFYFPILFEKETVQAATMTDVTLVLVDYQSGQERRFLLGELLG